MLKEQLTADRFKAFYGGVVKGSVRRYEVDAIEDLNFVAEGALGSGVSRSQCLDNDGKSLFAAVRGFDIEVPDEPCEKLHGKSQLGRPA